MPQQRSSDDRSMIDLVKEIVRQGVILVRQVLALARAEMSEKAARVARRLAALAVGGIVAVCGAVFVMQAASHAAVVALAALGLSEAAAWIAGPLVVGAVALLAAWGMVIRSLRGLARESLAPQRTARTLAEQKRWLEEKLT